METNRHVDLDWNEELVTQLEWHWDHQLRPRLQGLTDDEYFWEPVADCWSVRRRVDATSSLAMGAGEYVVDFAIPEPQPAPVTTIAWRLAHVIVGCLAARTHSHFGGPAVDWGSWEYADTAAAALRQLDEQYAAWMKGVRGLGATGLAHPVGQAEGPFAESSMAGLVLHINREMIHHGAEIALLRDLYLRQGTASA
jgi:hypothetical protein